MLIKTKQCLFMENPPPSFFDTDNVIDIDDIHSVPMESEAFQPFGAPSVPGEVAAPDADTPEWLRSAKETLGPYKWYIVGIGGVILIWICWGILRRYRDKKRRERINEWCAKIPEDETIFVSVASYRDSQCAATVYDIFDKAACPFRISVGVCQQNYPIDEDVMEGYKSKVHNGIHDFSSQIRVLRLSADEAQGPMYARSRIEKELYRGEKYYLLIDSHTMFTPDWDVQCRDMLNQCKQWSKKPVLSMYPEDFKPYNRVWTLYGYSNQPGAYLRFKKFNDKTGIIEIEGPRFKRKPTKPQLGMFWGACFSFGYGSQIKEVPFDPHCPYVFMGEEISMAARLWTSGYDIYHPHVMVLYHMWARQRPTFWQQFNGKSVSHEHRRELEEIGYKRLKNILQIEPSQETIMPPYGLGTERTLGEYQDFIGIDMKSKKFKHLGAILGIPISAKSPDILNRFGTWKDYKKAQENVNYLVQNSQQS
jgi:hypothetical protein